LKTSIFTGKIDFPAKTTNLISLIYTIVPAKTGFRLEIAASAPQVNSQQSLFSLGHSLKANSAFRLLPFDFELFKDGSKRLFC